MAPAAAAEDAAAAAAVVAAVAAVMATFRIPIACCTIGLLSRACLAAASIRAAARTLRRCFLSYQGIRAWWFATSEEAKLAATLDGRVHAVYDVGMQMGEVGRPAAFRAESTAPPPALLVLPLSPPQSRRRCHTPAAAAAPLPPPPHPCCRRHLMHALTHAHTHQHTLTYQHALTRTNTHKY